MAFFDSTRPLVFAHRGGCRLGPENTLTAFDRGLAAGADGLELDVHLSRDGVPVVIHDATLDRTTNGAGLVSERLAEELAALDAAHHFVEDGRQPLRGTGIGIPSLATVLERYREIRLIIEMKDDTADIGRAVARVIRAAGAEQWVCAAGSGAQAGRAVREMLPGVAVSASKGDVRSALYRSWVGLPLARAASYQGFQVPERSGLHRIVSPRFVRAAHAADRAVQVWTVDSYRDCVRLLQWGVDGLISDRPDLAVEARDEFLTASSSSAAADAVRHEGPHPTSQE